jgi:hypothetical protein
LAFAPAFSDGPGPSGASQVLPCPPKNNVIPRSEKRLYSHGGWGKIFFCMLPDIPQKRNLSVLESSPGAACPLEFQQSRVPFLAFASFFLRFQGTPNICDSSRSKVINLIIRQAINPLDILYIFEVRRGNLETGPNLTGVFSYQHSPLKLSGVPYERVL